jgi:hypothetical protein
MEGAKMRRDGESKDEEGRRELRRGKTEGAEMKRD